MNQDPEQSSLQGVQTEYKSSKRKEAQGLEYNRAHGNKNDIKDSERKSSDWINVTWLGSSNLSQKTGKIMWMNPPP